MGLCQGIRCHLLTGVREHNHNRSQICQTSIDGFLGRFLRVQSFKKVVSVFVFIRVFLLSNEPIFAPNELNNDF